MHGTPRSGHRHSLTTPTPWWAAALLLALVLVPALVPPAPLFAEGPVTMQVRVGFDGRARLGSWTPVVVEVENTGPNLSGELMVVGDEAMSMGGPSLPYTTEYAVQAALPQGARKRFTLYVPLDNTDITVRLVQDGQTLAEAEGSYSTVAEEDLLVGVLAQGQGAAATLPAQGVLGQGRGWTVVPLSEETLPPLPHALRAFDLILLGDFVTLQLSPEQAQALEDWVGGGGTLVVFGGAEARRTLGGLPPSLLPVAVAGSTTVAAPAVLERWGGRPLASDRLLTVSTGTVSGGRALAAQGDLPLVALAERGSGSVLFLAFDPSLEPLAGWPGLPGLWRELLSRTNPEVLVPAGGVVGPPGFARGASFQNPGIASALSNLPALDLPSVKVLAGIIAAYVLLVGPVNYLVLRRLRRRAWSWLTIPLLVALFSGGTFLLALKDKGSDVLTSTVSLVHLSPDSPRQRVESYVGVFAPSETSYRLSFEDGGLVSSLGDRYYGRPSTQMGSGKAPVGIRVRQDQGAAELLGMSMWSMRSVWAERSIPLSGGLETRLRLQNGRLEGAIRNTTDLTLRDSYLIVGMSYAELGDLAPGASAEVQISALGGWSPVAGPPPIYQIYNRPMSGPPTLEDRERMRKQQVIQSVLSPKMEGLPVDDDRPLFFFGWTDDLGAEVTVDRQAPRGSHLTAVLAALPLEPVGTYQMPPGFIQGYPIAVEGGSAFGGFVGGRGRPVKGYPGGFQFAEGSVTLQFAAPFAAGKPVTALRVSLPLDGVVRPSDPFEAALYNWRTGEWDLAALAPDTGSKLGATPPGTQPPGAAAPTPAPVVIGGGSGMAQVAPAWAPYPTGSPYGGQPYVATPEGDPADYLAADGTVRLKLTKATRDTLSFGPVTLSLEGGREG
ncbi:MAG: hypothetical protein HY689_14250 [Chloroflexi bacterium]|nr:hypothetical protein [Chloroflexota bacterium]